jgi:hypothetical protein
LTVALLYPYVLSIGEGHREGPVPTLKDFEAISRRFVESYKAFPAGYPHDLLVICCQGKPTRAVRSVFEGVRCRFVNYFGQGWDSAAYQFAINNLPHDFVVSLSTRQYFHRPGWLARFVDGRQRGGEGLYGATASLECGPSARGNWPNPHIRLAFFGVNPAIFRRYPYRIRSRNDGFRFESGDWNLSNWYTSMRLGSFMVTWDGIWTRKDWRRPPNIFRRGDQSNLLAWDRHTEIYAQETDPAKKQVLEKMADGISPS